MGWSDGPKTWKEMYRVLSDGRARNVPMGAEGDSPAWSRKRQPYEPPPRFGVREATRFPYAELHCHSAFSFLDGASHPEKLAEEAARLGLDALALTDHDGMYGIVRFAEAARAVGLSTIFGAEVSIGATRIPNGIADPQGDHLVILARDRFGYARLCRAISLAQLRGEKGRPVHELAELSELCGGRWVVLTGCRKGAVPKAMVERGPAAARNELARLIEAFGRDNVCVELWDHGDPMDSHRNDALAELATDMRVELVATNNVHYATPRRFGLYTALAAVRARRSLDEMDGWLPAAGCAHLRSGAEMRRRFARYPGVVERASEIGLSCAFDLRLIAPNLPPYPVPVGETEATFLRQITYEGALRRYGPRESERVEGAWAQIDRELHVIEQMQFPGYFLIVWDIVEFCRKSDILVQGRGSAANSAVCYALGITNADAVSLGLLFERFLSPARDGPPDIDLDIEAGRREEAIQYVYERYGRHNAAQVANVITYRPRSAIRDAAKALGFSQGQQDAWSKQIDGHGGGGAGAVNGWTEDTDIPHQVLQLAAAFEQLPRHLGIHSGGMVLCSRPIVEVCPVEWGRMEGRTVLQWDKDDCADVGLVKFDLLGLGMLTAIHEAIDIVREAHGVDIDIAMLPQESAVYDMLCEADTVGVFQIESRAQMATLPRLKPRTFYDLVVEVALIRPGPIQGGSVHPYIRRRNGEEAVTYLHPLLEPALRKTLGVPLFQEQLMQIAIDVAGFSAADADELRQAMGSKRSRERFARLRDRFFNGMAKRGITGDIADNIWAKLEAFANFGFPESHSVSFSYLVYISAWLKYHYPAAFCAALLNAQPMGFWSPHTLVADARRHGVVVRSVDINASAAKATVEAASAERSGAVDGALRLGIGYVRSIGEDLAKKIDEGRPYASVEDVITRCGLTKLHAEALATSGAFECFEPSRRKTLWTAGAAAGRTPKRSGGVNGQATLPGMTVGGRAPELPAMSDAEIAAADLWATSIMPNGSPLEFVRPLLDDDGVLTAQALKTWEHGRTVKVAGVVTHRQRPATAEGVTFLNLEDETGLVNVICSVGVWRRYKRVARAAKAMVVTGRLQRVEGVINLVAMRLEALDLNMALTSRNFR